MAEKYYIKNIENKWYSKERVIDNKYSYCIDANYGKGTTVERFLEKKKRQLIQDDELRIRVLTSLECWRLLGFNDSDYWKAKAAGVSETQLYKQAGNSIVVNVLMEIFKNLFLENNEIQNNEYKLF